MPDPGRTTDWRQTSLWAAVAVVATGAIAGSMVFTGLQIRAATRQIEALNIYNVQKDGRDLFEAGLADDAFRDYVLNFDEDDTYDNQQLTRARARIGLIVQFYASIFNQYRFGGMSTEAWDLARADMCNFFRIAPVAEHWRQRLVPSYSRDFAAVVEGCRG